MPEMIYPSERTALLFVDPATAAFSHDMMHAAHDLNGPTFAHAILTTDEVIAALPQATHSKETVK